jgi:hypothetical protein
MRAATWNGGGVKQSILHFGGAAAAVLAFAMLSGWPAHACGFWRCGEGYGYRQPTRVYGYYKSIRPGEPIRAPSRLDVLSAPPVPGGSGALLINPYAVPGSGPSLFGPPPAAAYYYNAPSVRQWRRRYR